MKNKNLIIIFIIIIVTILNFATISKAENLSLYSDSAILIENKTGKVLFEKNSEQKMYPASTTKILTAILTIEKGNLQDEFTVSKEALSQMKSGYSSAYLVEGEVMTIENLLKVLLIHSANDASNVLAEYVSGSIDNFVNLMNSKLEELGCSNSHFVTTNGLHDDNHYTTAADMAKIARYCMQNATFRQIVSSQTCIIPATNKSPERIYKNTNDLQIPSSEYYNENCIGIKTGYTSQAKNCLVAAASKNNLQLISVVFGASHTENNKSARCVDTNALFDYGFENYQYKTIAQKNTIMKNIEISNATKETKSLDLILENDITSLVNKNNNNDITPNISLNENIKAPIAKNTIVGKVTYTIDGAEYTCNLLASHDVIKGESLIVIIRVIFALVLFIIVFAVVLTIIYRNKKRKKQYN